MLVLSRKENETIRIGDDIVITLVRVKGGSVRVGIDAPRDVKILRGELEDCSGEKFENEAFAHQSVTNGKAVRNRLPMATSISPVRAEKVTRQTALVATADAPQTISA